jgi:hypothetical protein
MWGFFIRYEAVIYTSDVFNSRYSVLRLRKND